MWSFIKASVEGTSHNSAGVPCQDACDAFRLKDGDDSVLVAAIADGAGSAEHSELGARAAVDHLLKVACPEAVGADCLNEQLVRAWYQGTLEHLEGVAVREFIPVKDLACTLLLAVVWKNGAVLAQIGDGAWVLEKDGELMAGTWPENGEFANVTVFLTSQGAFEHLQFKRIEGRMSAVAGFTDGIQSLALDFGARIPGVRFFNAMFSSLRSSSDATELLAPLRNLLESEMICSRTDDDKTLVLGVWRDAETAPLEVKNEETAPAEVVAEPVNSDGSPE